MILFDQKVITKNEQKKLLEWIYNNENLFVENIISPNRKFLCISNIEQTPNLFFDIKLRILKRENITNYELDPFFGDMITWNMKGGCIHPHKDPSVSGKEHIRFNLFLSKPESGGDPIYNNKKLNFKERSYIKYNVSKNVHMSMPVIGSKPRIAISYGISVNSY